MISVFMRRTKNCYFRMSAETETETKTDNFLSLSITKGHKLTDAIRISHASLASLKLLNICEKCFCR